MTDTDTSSPPPEEIGARLREQLHRIEDVEEFMNYALPLLQHLEKQKGDGPDASGGSGGSGDKQDPPKPVFAHTVAWVEEWFLPTFRRKVGGGDSRWCAQWWKHAEAMTRFEGLWRSWEVQRLDAGTGLAAWLTNILDPQLSVITSADGPFAQCSPERHEPLPCLPSLPVPAAVVAALTAVQDETAAA